MTTRGRLLEAAGIPDGCPLKARLHLPPPPLIENGALNGNISDVALCVQVQTTIAHGTYADVVVDNPVATETAVKPVEPVLSVREKKLSLNKRSEP